MERMLACCADPWKGIELGEALVAVSAAGYDGVEGFDELYRDYAEKVEIAKLLLTKRNLKLATLTGRGDIIYPDKRANILKDNLRLAEFLSRMGAESLVLETGSREIVESIRDDFRAAAETLNELGKRCGEYDLYFCIQPRMGDRIQTEEEIDRILNAVETHDVSLCLDTGQLHRAELDPVSIVKVYGSCIKHLHCSDVPFPPLPGDEPETTAARDFCPPGQGVVDFPGLANGVQSMRDLRWIAARFDAGEDDVDAEIGNARDYLKKLFARGENREPTQ